MEQPNPAYGTLICNLVDRRSSVPFSDARVTCVFSGGIIQVDVDQRGEFRADFPEGVFELVISARGEIGLTMRGVGILGGHTQHMTRAFIPGEDDGYDGNPASAIGGYLTDRLGHPVVDAAVTAMLVPPKGTAIYDIQGVARTYATQSDSFGAYIFHAMKPGTYDIIVRTAQRTLSNERVVIPDHRTFVRHDLRLMMTI